MTEIINPFSMGPYGMFLGDPVIIKALIIKIDSTLIAPPVHLRLHPDRLFVPIYGCIPHDDWWRPEYFPEWFVPPNYGLLDYKFLFTPPMNFRFSITIEGTTHLLMFAVLLIGLFNYS